MVRVDGQLCDSCAACVSVCPADALMLDCGLAVDAGKCISCGRCVAVCPYGALALETEKGKAR